MDGANLMAVAAGELRHYLRLACETGDAAALRAAVQQRFTATAEALAAEQQAQFVSLFQLLPLALRGAAMPAPAMQILLARLGESGPDAATALGAAARTYTTAGPAGGKLSLPPAIMLADVVGQVAGGWKSATPSSALAARLAAASSHGLIREQAPGLLEAAQAAWRAGSYDAGWDQAVRRLVARSTQSFPWGLNQVALMMALTAADRIEGSPWLGPLKVPMTAALREGGAWEVLLRDVLAGDGGSKPGKNFAAKAAGRLAGIGEAAFRERVMGWLAEHPLDPNFPDPDGDALKQLVWLVGTTGAAAAQPLGMFAQRCFVKVPQVGARSVKLGNAALAALGMVEPPAAGAAELDRLRQKVKYPSAQKQIEAALTVAAKRAGLTTEDLAELAVPDFELGDDGTARVSQAEGGAILRLVAGRQVRLDWLDAAGKAKASAPAALKQAAPAVVKDWTERKRGLEAMLAGQVARLEGFFEQDRDWDAAAWRARYAHHGLLGPLSRRLIWQATRPDGASLAFLPVADGLVDAAGRAVALDGGDRVRLWHPIDANVAEVMAWRAAIVARGVVQPFKQAHREIYRLTDAERETATYSNRFAGHILRQHQMLALAKARGWTGTLQGSFDGANDPTKEYRAHGLRVSYGAEGIEGAEGDLSPTGICLRVATDRVEFHKTAPDMAPQKLTQAEFLERLRAMQRGERVTPWVGGHAAVRLEDVPPRLFSEAMRDVDLFVGVASLGADPAWADGGPNGRFGEYWRDYAQADLAESGRVRHAVLAALLPRLNIADVCTLEQRHLVVRGRLRTYRIHIGSGSIFFEPEGQYLCIVQDRRGEAEELALPFEGDTMLSLILSKAVTLARDDLITETSILRQLGRLPEAVE